MLVALAGVIVAAMSTELNAAVSSLLLSDISGSVGMSHDPATWYTTVYSVAEIFGMAISPWFAITLSLRRWTLGVIATTALSSVLIPTTHNLTLLYLLRGVQGLCGGFTIPLLMTTALRALPPAIRLYGLACYSLTATFFPNLALAVAALWMGTGDSPLGWQWAFVEAVPLGLIAASLVWYGMIQDPPKLERFRKFDWRGATLVLLGFGSLAVMFEQGDRYDWFNSPTICVLALIATVCIPLFVINEWFHELPLLRLQMLGRRNFAYALITLFVFLIVTQAASTVPNMYLTGVQHYRPAQAYWITAEIAASQLLLLPLMAWLLDFAWLDARILSFVGMGCLLAACIGDSFLNSEWQRGEFYLWQGFASVGEAMIVMPLLMKATNVVRIEEAPFASAMVNMPRAVSATASVWVLDLIDRWRGALHSDRLTDQIGEDRFRTIQGAGVLHGNPPPLLGDGTPRSPHALDDFYRAVETQVRVLTISDMFVVLGCICVGLIVLVMVLPERTYPPRIALAKK